MKAMLVKPEDRLECVINMQEIMCTGVVQVPAGTVREGCAGIMKSTRRDGDRERRGSGREDRGWAGTGRTLQQGNC
jgi:hypothetical protein